MSSSLVSIIIPLFNRQELVKETLDSVLAQTYPHWECIVVDDGSTDDSVAVVSEYAARDARFKIFERHRGPKGAPTCRNIGLEKAEGEYVIFLDSDDLLAEFCLESRIQFTKEQFLDFGVFQSNYLIEGRYLNDVPIAKKSDDYLLSFLSHDLPWCITSVLWKRGILQTLNGFIETFSRLQDPELHTRALLIPGIRFKVFHDSVPDSTYRISYARPKLLPGLNGFSSYISEIYPKLARSKYDDLIVRQNLKQCLKQSEIYLAKNFERRNLIPALRLAMRTQRVAYRYRITDRRYLIKYSLYLSIFSMLSLLDLPRSQNMFLKKFKTLS